MKRHERQNELLSQLSAAEFHSVEAQLEPVALEFKELLHEQNKPIKHIYFPTGGVVSLVTIVQGDIVETGTIGREGMVGIPAFLGADLASNRAFVQVPGGALRMETARLHSAVKRVDKLQQLLMLYTEAVLAMTEQSVACFQAHPVEARMARWLLMTHDRVDGPVFPITQEFLGFMLGVRRAAINVAGQKLSAAGSIRYARGRISILDRASLELAACECYARIRAILDRVKVP